MDNNQSIDEILKQLKTSVSSEQSDQNSSVVTDTVSDYSEELLKQELRNQYFESDEDASYISENEYSIDKNFLDEAQSYFEESPDPLRDSDQDETITLEDTVADTEDSPEEISDEGKSLVLIETIEGAENGELVEDFVEAIDSFTEDVEDVSEMFEDEFEDEVEAKEEENIEEALPVAEAEGEDEQANEYNEPFEPVALEDVAQQPDQELETEDYEQNIVYTELPMEVQEPVIEPQIDIVPYEDVTREAYNEPNVELVPEAQEIDQGASRSTYISLMRNSGIDLTANETSNNRSYEPAEIDDGAYTEECDDVFEDTANSDSEDLDLSTINLMMQLGEREEVAERIGDKNIEHIIEESEAAPEPTVAADTERSEEYVDRSQDEGIRASYKKKHIKALFSMLGCAVLAIMSLIFEALPIFEVGMDGIFDYVQYPSFYILFGLQFVIFSSVICLKQLRSGVQSIMQVSPNRYALIVVAVCATVIYDAWTAIAVAIDGAAIPPLFNAMAALTIAISAVVDFCKITSNMNAFNVYSADASKYTFVDEKQSPKIAEKMYAGGLETTKKVYSAASVDFPRGFFRGIAEKDGQSRSMMLVLIVSLLVSIIATVVSAILGHDVYASLGAFMICLFASMPIVLMCADNIPLASALIRLSKRDIAIAGKGAVEKHSKCDVMVFSDLHMFKKCKTEDIGIAIYDKGVSYLALGCISALYSKIGGPLSGIEVNLPDVFKFQNVDIKRVTRNGIEAIVDKKHVLILGERSFLLRYGIAFPEDEKQSDRCSLCVSVNGGATAKLSVKYEPEPIFEMLVERLYREGIICAIETYDPLINSDMIAKSRTLGDAPVSVVHKNAEDYRTNTAEVYRGRLDGVIACSSRLKLAEAAVWIKKLVRIERISKIFSVCSSAVGLLAALIIVVLGAVGGFNQYHVIIYLLAQLAALTVMLLMILPSKKYFTVEQLYDELEQKSIKQQKKLERDEQRRLARQDFENIEEESNTDE